MDRDGDVDTKDVVAVAHRLGKKPYSANADVNEDGKITVRDLHIVIRCRWEAKQTEKG